MTLASVLTQIETACPCESATAAPASLFSRCIDSGEGKEAAGTCAGVDGWLPPGSPSVNTPVRTRAPALSGAIQRKRLAGTAAGVATPSLTAGGL